MIGGYFADLMKVLRRVSVTLSDDGLCWIVVGDSRYGGVRVPTAQIIAELSSDAGWKVQASESFRSMRSSAQQGGHQDLPETLLVLGPPQQVVLNGVVSQSD